MARMRRMPRQPESFRLWSRNSALSVNILRSAPIEYDGQSEESRALRRDFWRVPALGVRCMLESEDSQLGLPMAQIDLYVENIDGDGNSMFVEALDGAVAFRGVQDSPKQHVFYSYTRQGLLTPVPTGNFAQRLEEPYRRSSLMASHAKVAGQLLTANAVIATVGVEGN